MTMNLQPAPQEQSLTYLVSGLGNPGRDYRDTRHNVGFMLLDRLAERLKIRFTRMESKAIVAKGDYEGRKLILAKPQEYMNLSGRAVGALLKYYKIPTGNLIVAYDDVDLPLGTLRIRPGGGSAGQKGMTSIIERLGSEAFPRLRIGIDRPSGRMEAADYVLQNFSASELKTLEPTLDRGVEAVLKFVTEGLDSAMNLYNGREARE
jgi:PTH1 family peptidyl-tRNA hydrolase